jgi:hypothetical protein
MDVFSVLEKENTRRRVIGWPRRWNKVERRIYDDIAARHGRVLFASATTVRDRVVFPFARSLDIKKYFQCFFMPRAVAAFFAFPVADAFLVPATVPTGAVGPPLFSQVLAVSAALAAVRLSGSSQSVVSDVMIDNIRLCASDHDALLRTWFTLLDTLGRLGITVGDTVTHDDYAFLGMRFFHAASASERSLDRGCLHHIALRLDQLHRERAQCGGRSQSSWKVRTLATSVRTQWGRWGAGAAGPHQ